jgi:MIP family channel proteins
VKDALHECVVHGNREAVNPAGEGTKAAAHYRLHVAPGQSAVIRLRLAKVDAVSAPLHTFDRVLAERRREADEFYAGIIPERLSGDARRVMRQALAGMLWSKQWFHFDVRRWLEGDPAQPAPPPERRTGRNREWTHLYNDDVISMPDKWEYPWYAAWDLAFHTVALALVDADFAKDQLVLFLREWYMHPNGQIPAYEWNFSDVNPPVHAWAAWRVYKIDKRIRGEGDRRFLERVFQKLLLNFNWWVNRKDIEGKNVFQGGFLGLDNIGVFDRSAHTLPDPVARRALMGLAMGLTAIALILSPWGQRSGAHFNPATTLTFWRLGKVATVDAAFYALFQVLGGMAGVYLAHLALGELVGHPSVQYVATVPGASVAAAFAAEVLITFILMSVILRVSNTASLARFTPAFAGALVAIYISVEAPISGMSMNPARSLASAIPAEAWAPLWIYFVAPPLGMLAAAQVYVRRHGLARVFCAKLHHDNAKRCIFRCRYGELAAERVGGGDQLRRALAALGQ